MTRAGAGKLLIYISFLSLCGEERVCFFLQIGLAFSAGSVDLNWPVVIMKPFLNVYTNGISIAGVLRSCIRCAFVV